MNATAPLACRSIDAVCIDVTGADAEAFLKAQLTRNPPTAGAGMAVSAAWLDARGRVRALLRVLPREGGYRLLAERETAAAVLAKLRMFVLRARVDLALDEGLRVAAFIGAGDEWLASRGLAALAGNGAALGAAAHGDSPLVAAGGVQWLRLGPGLVYALGNDAELEAAMAGLDCGDAERVRLAEIRLGLPKLGAVLTERFVPQMLNLDLQGAVAFDKGCYPGQEVVARLKYRGEVKRRLRRFAGPLPAAGLPAPGGELVDAGGTAVGEIVSAARAEDGMELLAVVQLEAAAAALAPAADRSVALRPLPLPYVR